MNPSVYLKCENFQCELYGQEVEVKIFRTHFSIDDYCNKCHRKGSIRVFYNGIEANSIESFYHIVFQMVKELNLLKKLNDKNVADEEDKKRYAELYEQLDGLQCIDCGQVLVKHEL
jgi:hypothetical protein